MYKKTAVTAIALALTIFSTSASAQSQSTFKIATLNAAWLLDRSIFEKWTAACKAVGWDESSAPRDQTKVFEGLPYCNVHNGLKWPIDEKCPKLTKADSLKRPLIEDMGCRESKDLSDWDTYSEKISSLRAIFKRMADDGITMIALQEVSSSDAVRQVLPAGWEVHTSADETDGLSLNIPQHIGVAWKSGAHDPSGWAIEREFSTFGDRPLRPGLVFSESLGGRSIEFLVVHLKSGCSNAATSISAPKNAKEIVACPALEAQVRFLEKWIDERVGKNFVILGDFNRRMTFEKRSMPKTGQRADPKIVQMFPELNDNDPEGSVLRLAQPPREKNTEGKWKSVNICKNGHPALDHFIVSNALSSEFTMGPLLAHPITINGVDLFAKRAPFSAAPTDHCPHFVELRFKGASVR